MRPHKRQCLLLILLILLGCSGIISGCGKKGPLYLPEPTQQPKP